MEDYAFINTKYDSDMIKLKTIFPENIWLQIFKNITESDHYHYICAGSPYFHQLLLPLRTQILFPEVIKLCTKSMVLTEKSYSSLLLYRSVCKTWKQGVDAKIQAILKEINSDATDWKFFGYRIQNLNLNQKLIMCKPNINNQIKLDKFLDFFHNSHFPTRSNPFPSRSIHIRITSQSEIPSTSYNKLFDILQIYGHHIWHCYLLWFHNPEEMQQQVRVFCKLLEMMPNLQTLRIANVGTIENTEYLENLLTANTFPKFKNLELLAEHDLAGPIFSELLLNNSHIKRLSISELDCKNHSALFTTPLPNLEELHIMGFKSTENFSQLQSVQVQWPVKKLTFNFNCYNRDILIVNHVFNWIKARWSETLTDLSIIMHSSFSVSEIESSSKLPNLKNLRISMVCQHSLDFILSLSESVVSLRVYRQGMDGGGWDTNSKIQFFCNRGNLGKSNIWELFPRLREINYADDSWPSLTGGLYYTRDHWEWQRSFARKIKKEETSQEKIFNFTQAKGEEYSVIHPKYVSDMTKLETIFSEKIWLLIFGYISKSDDYHSICAGSPFFHKLLLPLRTQILFSEVINLFAGSMVSTYESYFTLLRCRSVCKAWKQGVDAILHQILSELNTDPTDWKVFGCRSNILSRNQERILYQPNLSKQSKLDKFLDVFHNSHFLTRSNPFPSRSILIHIRSDEAIYNKLLEILQIYGHHIWHCYAILGYEDSVEMQEEVQMFRKLLKLLPNVQTLRIYNETGWNENTKNLERYLTANPMPTLKNLKLLLNHYIPRPVSYQLMENHPHIEKLWISNMDWSNLTELVSVPLFNLEELHILSFESAGDFLQLQSAQLQFSLRKLTIFCHQIAPNVNSVFSWINYCWLETLTDLSIIIPSSVSVSTIKSSMELRSLKHLRIKMWRYACLDFILHLTKALVSLRVYQHGTEEYDESLEKNSKIQFFLYRWDLGYSNIWEFFPYLREIKYADRNVHELCAERTYRREHWEGYSSELIVCDAMQE